MFSKELQNRIMSYYENYYKSWGLKDFKLRAQKKLQEEQTEEKRLLRLEGKLGLRDLPDKNCFIMGAGTGGLAIVLKEKYGINVFGCEPDITALNILQEKLREKGFNFTNFTGDFGENLSFFQSDFFDLVYCYTVLEHVKDVEKCLAEMIRITKPKGKIYINTPNYDFPEERHYKLKWPFGPAQLPRFFSYLYLILRGKPIKFFQGLNLLTKKQVNKMLTCHKNIGFEDFGPPQTQEILIKKLSGTSSPRSMD